MDNIKLIPASGYVDALKRNGVDYFVTVPDWMQLGLHARIETGVDGIHQVSCCNEDQAVSVAAGLRIGGKNPIVVVQNQGIYACVNSLRAVCLDASIPTVFLVGQFGREFSNFGKSTSLSRRNTVRYLEPVLDAMTIPYWRIEEEEDLKYFDNAFETVRNEKRSVALVIGIPTGWN
ncbi:MAG: thiamine pyrophosphate-binding protein [Burkholderiaceae bacterium]|nr:thiamine pyrophosphate-binding protein [Burkholderiaceae bacterium]